MGVLKFKPILSQPQRNKDVSEICLKSNGLNNSAILSQLLSFIFLFAKENNFLKGEMSYLRNLDVLALIFYVKALF